MTFRSTYCIYYGWLCDDTGGEPNAAAQRIAGARVPLLIASFCTQPRAHRNLSTAVIDLMRNAGTQVYAYVSTRWGSADVQSLQREAREYLDSGVDGIFLDESHNFLDASKLLYYRGVARLVRDRGARVIVNPGVARCGADVMSVGDIVMVEHAWREFSAQSPWCADQSPERFMGVSSNEENAMGYFVDTAQAIEDTRQAWSSGVGWHASTDRYTRLPHWFEEYVAAVSA